MGRNTDHKNLSNSTNLQKEILSSQESIKEDRKLMARLLIIAHDFLNAVPIFVYPNIIGLFAKYGIKKSSALLILIKQFNLFIYQYILDEYKNIPIENWNNKRTLLKSNKKEKNIILCVFLLTFYEKFILFLSNFLRETDKINKEALISELKQMHDMIFVKTKSNIDIISDQPQNEIILFDDFEDTDSNFFKDADSDGFGEIDLNDINDISFNY